jgi:hypothetical protein
LTSYEDLGATARRIGLIGLLALLGALGAVLLQGAVFPQHAAAEKCETCEEEEPPVEEEVFEILTIKVEGGGSVSDGTEVICSSSAFSSSTCEAEYGFGEKVTLSAAPGAGMTFLGWGGSCSGTGTCSVTMSSAKSVTAKFADTTPPTPPTITSPAGGEVFEWTAEEAVSVQFSESDPSVVAFGCSLESWAWSPCSSPWSTGKLTAGKHTVYVTAKDAAGNVSFTSRSFEVVITSPPGEEEGGGGEEGGSGSGGTPGTATPTTLPAIAPPPVGIHARAVVKTRLLGKFTLFRKLALKGLPANASIAATCKGKGCPFKRKQVAVANGAANLTAIFAKHALAAGALIKLKVSAPGMTGETIDIKTRAGKAPKVTTS